MDELLTYIAQNLVNNPDDVKVDVNSGAGQVNLLLTVNPEDMGLIIGKGGQTIKAIRKLLITKAIVENVRVNLQLVEPEGYVRPEKPTEAAEQTESETSIEEAAPEETPSEPDETETPEADQPQEAEDSKE